MSDRKIKSFFAFSPPWRKINILFNSQDSLNTKIFKSLSQQILPLWYIKLRKTKPVNFLFRVKEEIPNNNVFLIYKGHDSTIYFYKVNGNLRVIRKKDCCYYYEDFLGYPIHWDYSLNHIQQKEILRNILRKHWTALKKKETPVHGDFTHLNILVNSREEVTIIDSQKTEKNSPIITDLFYFYSYLLHRASKYNKDHLYEEELQEIYSEILKNEKNILDSLNFLKQGDFRFSNNKKDFHYWKNRFKNFIKTLS
mgnify:CR=1 FL=1